jgi:type I restriction enzyme M protein
MTLHEAIEYTINIEGKPLSTRYIAETINALKIYTREDGKPVAANQVSARVNNTPLLFEVTDDGLVYVKKEIQIQYQRLVYQLQDLLRGYESRNVDIIIATYVFLERVEIIYPSYLRKNDNTAFTPAYRHNWQVQVGQYQTGFEITNEDGDLISELFQNLPPELERRVSDLLRQYDFSLNAISHRQFGAFFNNLLSSSSLTKGALGDFATPPAISKIITDLAEIKENETVFDPFAGNAGIFCDIIRTKKINYHLQLNDIDRYSVWLGKMNLVVNNFINFEYRCKDSIENYIKHQDHPKKFDWIITHPPFGGRISKDVLNSFRHTRFGTSTRSELVFLEMILDQLNNRGKAIIIVPESFLFTEDKAFIKARKYLVNNSLLSRVISLPTGAFLPYTSAKASVLFINNDISDSINEGIEFVDLSEDNLKTIAENNEFSLSEFIGKKNSQHVLATREEIEEEGYSLVVNRYLHKSTISYSDEYKRLKDIIKEKYAGFTYSQKVLNRTDGIPYVNIKDLSDEKQFYNLNPEKIDTFLDPKAYDEKSRQRPVPKHSILLAKIGNKLKPTLNASNKTIAVSGNILVLIPDTKIISPIFLISQFHEEYVLNQVNRIRGGAAQPFVRIDDLLNINIKVPSLDKQKEAEMMFTLGQMENVPTRELRDITQEEIDLPSAIKHEYKNLKNPLSSNISNLKDFLEQKIKNKEVIAWNDKIAANTGARSIETVFTDISELMGEMSSLIEDIATVVNLDKEGVLLNKKGVSAIAYIEKITKKVQREFPEAELKFDYTDRKAFTNVLIEIDDNLFSKVIRNFVSNSLNHGYEGSIGNKPVYIFLSITEDGLTFQIDLINDGKLFDDGFTFSDFISFGKKAGKNKGSGIGGFIMNQIILHHGGTLEMVEVERGDSLRGRINAILKTGIHFRIKLPMVK